MHERGRFPVDMLKVEYHHLPIYDVLPPDDELERYDRAGIRDRAIPSDVRRRAPAIVSAIDILEPTGHSAGVFHCSAGKDRTGVLAALLLGFLECRSTSLPNDYSLSAQAMVSHGWPGFAMSIPIRA